MSNCITRLRWTVELYRQLNCAYYENNNILFACYYLPNCFILLHTTKYTFLFRICRKTFYISLLDNLQYHLYLVLFTAYIIIKLLLVPTNMAKHIIMLTLCFMAYIIGNVDAKGEENRKYKFELAVKCYEQMFDNGIIKVIPDLQTSQTDTFNTIMTKFYRNYNIRTTRNNKNEIVPTLNNDQFITDELTDSFRSEFLHDFIQKGTDDVLKGHLTTLTAKISQGQLNDYPLKEFVLKYAPTSRTDYLRSTSAFCKKYSECPKFDK